MAWLKKLISLGCSDITMHAAHSTGEQYVMHTYTHTYMHAAHSKGEQYVMHTYTHTHAYEAHSKSEYGSSIGILTYIHTYIHTYFDKGEDAWVKKSLQHECC